MVHGDFLKEFVPSGVDLRRSLGGPKYLAME